jgi:hypothetical protein
MIDVSQMIQQRAEIIVILTIFDLPSLGMQDDDQVGAIFSAEIGIGIKESLCAAGDTFGLSGGHYIFSQ